MMSFSEFLALPLELQEMIVSDALIPNVDGSIPGVLLAITKEPVYDRACVLHRRGNATTTASTANIWMSMLGKRSKSLPDFSKLRNVKIDEPANLIRHHLTLRNNLASAAIDLS